MLSDVRHLRPAVPRPRRPHNAAIRRTPKFALEPQARRCSLDDLGDVRMMGVRSSPRCASSGSRGLSLRTTPASIVTVTGAGSRSRTPFTGVETGSSKRCARALNGVCDGAGEIDYRRQQASVRPPSPRVEAGERFEARAKVHRSRLWGCRRYVTREDGRPCYTPTRRRSVRGKPP